MRTEVYCQIAGRDISSTLCEQTQGQDGCVGCGAATRRCEKCNKKTVTIPIVGLCMTCLFEERTRVRDLQYTAPSHVQCQIMRSRISSAMCNCMQGQDGCADCEAPTRTCTSCSAHAPYSAKFGLCLECIIAEFAPAIAAENQIDARAGESAQLPKTVTRREVQRTQSKRDILLQKARELISKHRRVSTRLLIRNLGVSAPLGKELLETLVSESFIESRGVGYGQRFVYRGQQSMPLEAPPSPNMSWEPHIQMLDQLIEVAGAKTRNGRLCSQIKRELVLLDRLHISVSDLMSTTE